MLENNADIRHIQKLLGHSSISTTEIYTKVAKSMKKRVLDSYHPLKNKLKSFDVLFGLRRKARKI